MNTSMIRLLVATDLYRYRWMIIGSLIAGIVAIAVASRGGIAFGIGGIAFITNLVALGIFIGMYSLVQERKDRASIFVLSLPVSTRQYAASKIISASISYGVPWLLLTVGAILTILVTPIPNGTITSNALLLFYFLTNFFVFLAVAASVTSEKWIVATIIVTNMSISLVISAINLIPSIAANLRGPSPVWPPAAIAILAAELGVIALSIAIMVWVQSKRTDYV
jgi:ABC-type transport system involved in multi-copper enzyme maturation permease subunit